jgi:hypothetical protein
MQTIKEKINHLNQLILEGKAMEGFELYYDDEVIMQENENVPKVSKKRTAGEKLTSLAVLLNSAAQKRWM